MWGEGSATVRNVTFFRQASNPELAVRDLKVMSKASSHSFWTSRMRVTAFVGLYVTQGCMQVNNGAPVTPRTNAYRGTGTTAVTIETDLPIQRIDEIRRDSRTRTVQTDSPR